jgi:hypothetical protein
MGTKASGFAGAAGLVWPAELKAGRIEHALFFAYPYTKGGGPVAPATSSDGRTENRPAIPEGARVQLDPDLDLGSLDLPRYQRTIATAMQNYGMILGDTGGAIGLFAVGRQSYQSDPYKGLLPTGESFPTLEGIPLDRFRVLKPSAQQARPTLKVRPSDCGNYE